MDVTRNPLTLINFHVRENILGIKRKINQIILYDSANYRNK